MNIRLILAGLAVGLLAVGISINLGKKDQDPNIYIGQAAQSVLQITQAGQDSLKQQMPTELAAQEGNHTDVAKTAPLLVLDAQGVAALPQQQFLTYIGQVVNFITDGDGFINPNMVDKNTFDALLMANPDIDKDPIALMTTLVNNPTILQALVKTDGILAEKASAPSPEMLQNSSNGVDNEIAAHL